MRWSRSTGDLTSIKILYRDELCFVFLMLLLFGGAWMGSAVIASANVSTSFARVMVTLIIGLVMFIFGLFLWSRFRSIEEDRCSIRQVPDLMEILGKMLFLGVFVLILNYLTFALLLVPMNTVVSTLLMIGILVGAAHYLFKNVLF